MRIGVVGAGISGLSCAWLLAKRHDVTVFEKEPRLGGHSDTAEVDEGGRALAAGMLAVDMGFIVYNTASYPNLVALFRHLEVPTAPTTMGFSVSLDNGRYEYGGGSLNQMFAQRSNLVSPAHWRMLRDVSRFFREARAAHAAGTIDPAATLGGWLAARDYGSEFVERHILPMGAAIWSTPAKDMLRFPAAAFIRFFANHGLLQISDRPQWRTVVGGSREYVRRLRAETPADFATGDAVVRVARTLGGAIVRTRRGREEAFDAVVLACHADEALALIADADEAEARVLGAFRYSPNEAVLHRDARPMPRRRCAWAAWNYTGESAKDGTGRPVAVTYWMNALQPLATANDYFVTLNPAAALDEARVLRRVRYAHPMFDRRALEAQRSLPSLQGRRATWFAGAYFGYGFHEDGLQAGLAVAEAIGGVSRPWAFDRARSRIAMPRPRAERIGVAAE